MTVVTPHADTALAVAISMGNTVAVTTTDIDLELTNNQLLNAEGAARAVIDADVVGEATASASLFGNSASIVSPGMSGAMEIDSTQTVEGGKALTAQALVTGDFVGHASAAASSSANAISTGAEMAPMSGTIAQSFDADVAASSSLNATRRLEYNATAVSVALGNAVTTYAYSGGLDATINQTGSGSIAADTTVTADYADVVTASSSAAANSIFTDHADEDVALTAVQSNEASVSGRTEVSLNGLGWTASSLATASGNLALANGIGDDVTINIDQHNFGGGVEATAILNSGSVRETVGGVFASATATGNSAGGYACSDCARTISAFLRSTTRLTGATCR